MGADLLARKSSMRPRAYSFGPKREHRFFHQFLLDPAVFRRRLRELQVLKQPISIKLLIFFIRRKNLRQQSFGCRHGAGVFLA